MTTKLLLIESDCGIGATRENLQRKNDYEKRKFSIHLSVISNI